MERTKPLSYQSLNCVIPYMNASFRTLCVPHFPSLRNIQKMIPLRLDTLKLGMFNFTLDHLNCSFRFQPMSDIEYADRKQELMPGDIVIKAPQDNPFLLRGTGFPEALQYKSYILLEIQSGSNKKFFSARSQHKIKLRDAIRPKINDVLGGQRVHQVKHLAIELSTGILTLPEGLKLKIRELSVEKNGYEVLVAIQPILNRSSFPLKKLSVKVLDPMDPVFQNEILKTSESLNIHITGYLRNEWADLVMNLPNKKIHISHGKIELEQVFAIAKNWIKNSQSIGSKFSMVRHCSVEGYLIRLKNELQAVEGNMPKIEECPEYRSSFSLPINSTSEMNFYGYMLSRDEHIFVMEVMPIGTFEPDDE